MIYINRQRLICSWKGEHGYWPSQHHPTAIAIAERAARTIRHAALILQRMHAHQCLICGSSLVPAAAKA